MQSLNELGLRNEIGMSNGGWYSPIEIQDKLRNYGLEEDVSVMFSQLRDKADSARLHEIIHCFDVGFGAIELVEQIAKDRKAQEKLGLNLGFFTPEYYQAVFLSGLFHDMILSFGGDKIETTTPEQTVMALVAPNEYAKFQGKAQYIKDDIGDDLRGAILLNMLGGNLPEQVRDMAVSALLAESDLNVAERTIRLLGKFSPHKILDAIWYHDGNYPIRGHAEADSVLGDRVRLYEDGKIGIGLVGKGIKKLLEYTEIDPNWEERSRSVDIAYLEKFIGKKVGNFMNAIAKTDTYDFVVEELASRERSYKALRSHAFLLGIAQMPPVLNMLEVNPTLKDAFGQQIDNLHHRYEEAMNLYRKR